MVAVVLEDLNLTCRVALMVGAVLLRELPLDKQIF